MQYYVTNMTSVARVVSLHDFQNHLHNGLVVVCLVTRPG